MNKVVPILPCPDIKVQVAFYQQLGFELKALYTSPSPYAVLQLGNIELNFYGTRKMLPSENPTMCYIKLEDVDSVSQAFEQGLKKQTGKVPRSGVPRISKVRDLSSDRRFTLVDTGGNTFYIGTPVNAGADNFFRSLQHQEVAKKFSVLYDLLYSKEDAVLAEKMLPKLFASQDLLEDIDKAKLLLVALDIQRELGQALDDAELKALLESHASDEWAKIKKRYLTILQDA